MLAEEDARIAENTLVVPGNRSCSLRFAFVLMGMTGTVVQVILLREFLVVFYGNELCIGIILGCWLFWVGVGSWIGNNLFRKNKPSASTLLVLLVLSSFVALFQVILIRFAHEILQIPTGEYIPLFDLFYFAFFVLCLGCSIFGLLFTTASQLHLANVSTASRSVSEVYVFESIGSIVGGLLFSFVLVSVLSTLQNIAVLALAGSLLGLWFNWKFFNMRRIVVLAFTTIFVAGAILLLAADRLEHIISTEQWRAINEHLSFIESTNSKYENLAVVRLQDQYTIYADGKPDYTIADRYSAESLVHLIMVQSPLPKRVLLIGGGFHGPLAEILKYNPSRVDYVELDNKILELSEKYLPSEDGLALCHSAVRIHIADGRSYVKFTKDSSDIVILGMGEPSTAAVNRFYTYEFFQDCKNRLASHGILALTIPSSADYIGPELQNFNASIYHTLKLAFPSVLLIPGTRAILFAAKEPGILSSNAEQLAEKFSRLQIKTKYFSPFLYEQLMPQDRISFVTSKLESTEFPRLNYDSQPVSYYFDLVLWNRLMKQNTALFDWMGSLRLKSFFIPLVVLTLAMGSLVLIKREKAKRITAIYIMFIAGVASMVLSLLCMLNFQTIFGSIYEMVGTLIASFMAGLAIGGITGMGLLKRTTKQRLLLILLLVIMVFFCTGLPFFLDLLLTIRSFLTSWALTLFSGALIGALFAVTNECFLSNSNEKRLGTIYAADLFGSCISAVVSSSILVPILGVQSTSFLLAGFVLTGIIISLVGLRSR
jgi:spermidine synthase